ncbi:B3/B4 domain-containing protein [Companilactobacillus zhongbaensis]|uniref:B3/B4 domain-containing protein n=1 Tax=Companilactobacillus zhongbaensis TaxID=2486009 RepID=UPI000F7A03E7|nr:phenylalanine--tRNA ligase beta subunit-related protein [Companilactobacillus zhongbaensis]
MKLTRNEIIPKNIQLAVTKISFKNSAKNQAMWDKLLDPLNEQISTNDTLEDIRNSEQIKATKASYKELGKDPSRFRPSSDALWRRVVKGKGLYQINALVDLNNYLSLKYKMPFGSYDLNKVSGDINLTKGESGASYAGIGKSDINIENLLVLADDDGPFGSPTSDSTRAMISDDTVSGLVVGYLFGVSLDDAAELQKGVVDVVGRFLDDAVVLEQDLI